MKFINRLMELPNRSFFLLGPRATGKTTWLKQRLPHASWYNLLRTQEYLRLSNSDTFVKEVSSLPEGSWIVIDEVQRRPELLNEVHYLMGEFGNKYRFALTGSSARKLKSKDVNLLAGRASTQKFFPLTFAELGSLWNLDLILNYGCLPGIYLEEEVLNRIEFLDAYADTYLKEEILQESVVRNLEGFSRFLKIASLMNGQILNTSNTGRDAHISRQSVDNYFQILSDTLIGFHLNAWQPRAKVKEVGHPKFYFFDSGIVRVLSGKLRSTMENIDRGNLFETYLLHEIRAYIQYKKLGGELFYWRTTSGTEIDLIWNRDQDSIAFEFKTSSEWKPDYLKGFKSFSEARPLKRAIGVYLGEKSLKADAVEVYPIRNFLEKLWSDQIF